ncbi:hypothetical protein XM38_013260 [Halomicronema hongdechloris C2206]|uniref:Uncharacterized protein n=1 Tax=Halomicronema hongdechloris C2206 TaxID=1641165 RepID=A0A1Z3HJB2_9CYAN|nr:hypothetical protein [Halomicronema hongdechloris]ASC70388.1 hypothetical protein XM38_013260 [Halomicronema hongdechloris C2206]
MQAVVNPGEAKQIEQDYAHTTLASSEIAAVTAQSTAEAVQAFIQMLRDRLQAARKRENAEAQTDEQWDGLDELPQDTPEPIEIKLGREIVYREGYADKDPIDKLSLNKLKLLQAALDVSAQTEDAITSDVKGTINIKAGDELVYRLSKGAVEVNQLHPSSAANQQEDPALEVDQSSIKTADVSPEVRERAKTKEHETPSPLPESVVPSSITTPEPAIPNQQPLAAQPLKSHSPNVVSILEVLDRQNQQVVETATRQWMQQTTRVMRRSSQQLTDKVVAIAANIRSRQVASTAVDLLQKFGTTYSPGRGLYVAEKYSLNAKGRMVTITDREGTELMMFRKTRWGLDILKNEMVASQEADFLKARQQIHIQGLDGISSEPPMRSRQLGNLAPAADRGLTRDLTALALAKTARKLLDVIGSRPNVQGKRIFQGGSQYRIEETPNSLKLQAAERGTILSIDNGKIKSELTPQDITYFRFIDRELSQDLKLPAPATLTPLNPRQRHPPLELAAGE